jgi:hypothetical protein
MADEKIPLTDAEYRTEKIRIIKSGFLPFEAEEFLTAKGGYHNNVESDIRKIVGSEPFKFMLKSRLDWIHDCQKIGWSGQKIGLALRDYYKLKSGRTPFDFLKIEYKPPQKLSDYAYGVQLRASTRIKRMSKTHFGIAYEKRKQREWRPVDTPKLEPNPVDNIWQGIDKNQ